MRELLGLTFLDRLNVDLGDAVSARLRASFLASPSLLLALGVA